MKYVSVSRFENALLFILILGMLILPTSYMMVKLGLIIVLIVLNYIKGRYKFSYNQIVTTILFLILLKGFWNVFNGFIKESLEMADFQKTFPFLFLYPILFNLMFPYLRGEQQKEKCYVTITIAHVLILGFNIYNLFASYLGLPRIMLAEDFENVRMDDYYLGISTNNLHQLIFTTPFVCALGYMGKIKTKFFIPMAILTFIFILITSRAALIVVAGISLIMPYLLERVYRKVETINTKKYYYVIFIALMLMGARYSQNIYVNSSMEDFISHFVQSGDLRFNQREVLYKEWMKMPITGQGAGKKFQTYDREASSVFESTYHNDLAHNGLIGFGIFCIYIGIILYNLYKRAKYERDEFYFACWIGFVCCVICASTNPILGTFDRLFSMYISIACLSLPPKRILNTKELP